MATKTSFSFKGTVDALDLFQGGHLRIRIKSDDGHLVEVWQDVAVGEAFLEKNEDGTPKMVDLNDGRGMQPVINREQDDVPKEPFGVEAGDAVSVSVSISTKSAS